MQKEIINKINEVKDYEIFGSIVNINQIFVVCKGISPFVMMDTICAIINNDGDYIIAQVVKINSDTTELMSFEQLVNVSIGCQVKIIKDEDYITPSDHWIGRIMNGMNEPIDKLGDMLPGNRKYPLYSNKNVIPIDERDVLKKRMPLGIKGIDSFLPCCYGQRMGIFSGSGIGKSTLVSMIAGFAKADVKIIGLIGERSRELREFIDNYLHTMENTIVVISTGNESPMLRKRCTYLTVALAEYFRDQGKEVLCILDSITRFAHAQREIGIAMGEPPTSRSYTPSTFTQLPILMERTGIGKKNQTSITTLITVLVDGDDDIEDPIADAVRGILDGHILLNRNIANSGRFPAIDIIKSVSRSFLNCTTEEEQKIIKEARKKLNLYEEMKDMIRIGAYKSGENEEIDDAIVFYRKIEDFLSQSHNNMVAYDDTMKELAKILNS